MFAALRTLISRWITPPLDPVPDGAPPTARIVAVHYTPYCENLLEKARIQWQFGDWQSLAQLQQDQIEHHPDRAKLALLAAVGRLQISADAEARQYVRLAQDWGAGKKLVSQILIGGVYNSLGKAAALGGQKQRALGHFEQAVGIGIPSSDKPFTQALEGRLDQHQSHTNTTIQALKIEHQFEPSARNQLARPSHQQIEHIEVCPKNKGTEIDKVTISSEKCSSINLSEIEKAKIISKYGGFSSEKYWEERYKNGDTSGYGSYGRLAQFKADIINKFIVEKNIQNIIEFGCGDGNQLSMINVSHYIGIDVSSTVIEKCRKKFGNTSFKSFYTNNEYKAVLLKSELSMSLDVLFHLIEDDVFSDYMTMLFSAAEKYCIIYSCNDDWSEKDAVHVRRRRFSKWIDDNILNWCLFRIVYNKYPFEKYKSSTISSFSDFYFYKKISLIKSTK